MRVALFSLFALILTSAIVGLIGMSIADAVDAHRSCAFPTVMGTITSSRVVVSKDSDGDDGYDPQITYEYQVAGVRHSGREIGYGKVKASSRRSASALVDAYPVRQQVPVYYNPRQPLDAALRCGVQGAHVGIVLGLMLFVWADWMLLEELWRSIRRRKKVSVRLWRRGDEIHIRQGLLSPLSEAALAFCMTCFMGAISFADELPSAFLCLVVAACVAAITYRTRLRKMLSGLHDIILHPGRRALRWPGCAWEVGLSQVLRTEVVPIEPEEHEGNITYDLVLHYKDPQGSVHKEPIGHWPEREMAEAAACWIDEQVSWAPGHKRL